MLSNKSAQYHTRDLFDIETCCMDLAEHAKVLAPNLAPNLGQPLSNTAVPVDRMDCSNTYTEDQLIPLYGMIGKLQGLMDDHIHLQQAAGTTSCW